MRTILTVGEYNLLLPQDQNLEEIVKLAEKSIQVRRSYGRPWSETLSPETIEIKIVSDHSIILGQDETE